MERNPVMKQRNSFNRTRRILGAIVAIIVLVAGFGILPGVVSGQAAPTGSPLKIGTIGSGNIGSTLGTLWVKSGHPVLFSSRHPEELKSLADGLGPLARAGTVREA